MTSLPPMPDQIELAERVLWVLCLSAQTLDFLDILKKVLQKKIKKKKYPTWPTPCYAMPTKPLPIQDIQRRSGLAQEQRRAAHQRGGGVARRPCLARDRNDDITMNQ